ncbi:SMP-30/gluconolactonase/LRE family protein [Pseudomonas sp. A3.4]|nr:SMP-30/gluconolactonase/LRE family protein [Atopomonas sediminilitoris]MCJ8168911.1 SMP-30/gluconolactonase/LRE family protein [Atopomonas sediminilitoris]
MRALAYLGLLLLIPAGYLTLTPSPINAAYWQAPVAPAMTGVMEPNDTLMKAELLALGQIHGPEDTAVDSQGRVYAGLEDGRIIRLDDQGQATDWVNTGGRPLGMDFAADGHLIVADAWKGLLKISPQGEISVLSQEADGLAFAFTDDLDIASDGKIYFSDASSKFNQPDYLLDLLEARPHGRLLMFDPATNSTSVLLDGLYFANGVALSQNEDFVLVNETYRYRITRYWLKGERAGESEVFIDNLPGMPDNLQGDRAGTFWVALPTPRKADADFLHQHPWLKEQLAKLPRAFWPKAQKYGLAIALNEQGEIIHSLHDTSGTHLRMITSVKPVGDYLYFGSLDNDRIGKLPKP